MLIFVCKRVWHIQAMENNFLCSLCVCARSTRIQLPKALAKIAAETFPQFNPKAGSNWTVPDQQANQPLGH